MNENIGLLKIMNGCKNCALEGFCAAEKFLLISSLTSLATELMLMCLTSVWQAETFNPEASNLSSDFKEQVYIERFFFNPN